MKRLRFLMPLTYMLLALYSYTDASIIDTLTEQDKSVLSEYKKNHLSKPIDETMIKGYILYKLGNVESSKDTLNGFLLIYQLTTEHKADFDHSIITLLEREIRTTQTYEENISQRGVFTRGLYTLGVSRTELAIQYLLTLVEPTENWPASIRESVLKNDDRDSWIHEIQVRAMGALLEPMDLKGAELIPILDSLIHSFPSSDEVKGDLIEKLEIWKLIYREKGISISSTH